MADFSDVDLTPRARRMAEWLCDLTDTGQAQVFRDASCEMLLRELPDHWTADDVRAMSAEIRASVGRGGSRRAWLTGANWLVGEEERLPEYERSVLSEFGRMSIQRQVRTLLAGMQSPERRQAAVAEDERHRDLKTWAANVVAAVKQQRTTMTPSDPE